MGKLNPMLAITLAASLAALGCTTNHNLGNGTPTRSGPEVRTAPTSGVTGGGEVPANPPMTSSYNRSEILPVVKPRLIRRSADEAAAIMAGSQPVRGRYLGVVNPGSAARGYQSDGIQNFQNPALITNPQLTINSSISSQPNEVINTSAEDVVATGVAAAATIAGTATPTTAATAATPTTAATTLLPTFASAGNPTVTAASVGLGRTTAQAATSPRTLTPTATAATTATGTRAGAITSPVRILRSSGTVTVTNAGTPTGRNQ